MGKRVSHSLLDPWIGPCVPALYRAMRIPARFPPEGIILVGHLVAIAGAVGFAFSATTIWGGLLGAAGAIGNHLCDCVDGMHARRTGQCRNGGELLDHFTDPLSFSYWLIGLAIAADRPWLAVATIVILYATAVLTNIKAKMVGEFTLARFGATEFKAVLALFGLLMAAYVGVSEKMHVPIAPDAAARWFLWALAALGALQLVVNLVRAVKAVNAFGVAAADTSEWVLRSLN